jgi:hypothetical protein
LTNKKYYQNFQQRLNPDFDWGNYTPYELRTVGTFIYLNQKERAYEMLNFFFNDQRPQGWNNWVEVVWKNPKTPKFIGHMPHTWVGSDYINAVRSFFVYEDEAHSSLVIGEGLLEDWMDSPEGIEVNHLPTFYGELNYSIQKTGANYRVNLMGNIKMPQVKIRIKNFKNEVPKQVFINNKSFSNFNLNEVMVKEFPAIMELKY